MTLEEGRDKFIHAWGTLGTEWGINRTMAQIHALLLLAPKPMTADDIMEALKISRGNANMNIRALIDWGLVFKELIPGERKDFFVAEKDIWEVVRQIIIHRKKKELEPALKVLDEISAVQPNTPEAEAFLQVVTDIKLFSTKADSTLDHLTKADSTWFVNTFLKMIR